ncbi:hypothetical protein K7P76_13310 [Cohnella sp. NL03-T5]|nr:hypothetical protein [Cohnella silvisoli]
MASLSNDVFPVANRVPGAEGEGFDLRSWFSLFIQSLNETYAEPTHLVVRASDEFQATIPWGQLNNALLQFAVNGLPLVKGRPIRLYVPDGTSACLNVKSVVYLRFVSDAALGEEAEYGFVNEISPNQLAKGLKSR